MGEISLSSPMQNLDLNNFDTTEANGSRYVLTSPRSLESCTRVGVKPVELLIKSLNEFAETSYPDIPIEAVTVLYQAYEKERRRLLRLCREEREKIIEDAKYRRPPVKKLSALETVLEVESFGSDSKSSEACGGGGLRTCVDLGIRRKSVSSRSSYSADIRETNCLRPNKNMVSSLSLGDLRHSPATERQLERLTRDIKKEMNVTVPEKDRKIAALMLVKHQEEQTRLRLSQQEEQEREETRRQEEARRAQTERMRRKGLERNMQLWQEELDARRRHREHQEVELASQREQEVLLQEDRWRRLTEEQVVQRRDKIEAARKEAEERKRYQEQLLKDREREEQMEREKERQLTQEKEQRARKSKVNRERRERKRLHQENQREQLRHLLLKQEVEQQMEAEAALLRSALQQKLQHSWEKRTQTEVVRLRELQERSVREDKQIQRAQLRATLQSHQQLTHKQVLAQLSQQRMEQAAQHTRANHRSRAQQAQQDNQERQRSHQRLKDRVRREEEAQIALRQSCIIMKEQRRERLQREREEVQEEARRVARASFNMRERVREQTHSRTFDQMALEAELTASLGRIKL